MQGEEEKDPTRHDASGEIDVTESPLESSAAVIPVTNDVPVVEIPTEIEDDMKSVGKEDCDALYKECMKIQIQNAKQAEKIKRINKVIRRIQKEKRFLIKKLEGFGDKYQLAQLKFIEEEELRIAHALQQQDEELAMKEPKKPARKKVKVKRLQNAPKKPSNAFLMFCQKNRNLVQEQYTKDFKTEISRQEMTRKLAELWKKTPGESRKAYYAMYEKDKERYAQEMKDYESRNPAVSQSEDVKPDTPDGNLVINEAGAPSAC